MKWTRRAFCWGVLGIVLAACSGSELGSVDGKPVTKKEFDAYLKYKRVPVTEKDGARNGAVLDQYLQRKGLALAIEDKIRDGDVVDADVLQAELDEFRREAVISRYFEKYLAGAVTDEAVTNYYNAHADQYAEKRVHVAHLLLRTTRAMSEAERRAKLTRAQEALSKLRAGQDFAKVAAAYSEDSISVRKGGDLGWVQQGAIDPKFSEVAFSVPQGQVSDVFETQFGYHVVKVLEAPQARQRPLEEVKGDIRYRLRSEAKEAEVRRLLESVDVKQPKRVGTANG